MKTDFRKWLPVIAMTVAVGGAFTTHAMSEKTYRNAVKPAYHQLNGENVDCIEVAANCSEIVSGTQCTIGDIPNGTPLFNLVGEQCTQPLYRPEQ